jgi:hypothetical protein
MLPVDREVKREIPVKGIEAKFEVANHGNGYSYDRFDAAGVWLSHGEG